MKPLKIALLGTRGVPSNYGGTETYVGRLAKFYAERGDEVIVYCAKSETAEEKARLDAAVPEGVRRVEVPSIPTKHLDNFVRSFLSCLHACFSGSDVVQLNNTGPAFFSLLPRLLGKKTVGAIRAIDSARSKWSKPAQMFLRFCDYLIVTVPHVTTVNSIAMQEYYRDKYGKETIYIPNGVEVGEPQGSDQLKQWGLCRGGYILFAARLEPEKGCHTLIEAYRRFKAKTNTQLKLVIAGNYGKTKEYTDELLAQSSDDVIFTGFQSGATLDELYANAFTFVLPSSVEGMSNSLLAAMAHGAPCVVSDIPENLAVIEGAPVDGSIGGQPGLSFKLDDPNDLARKLCLLVQDPQMSKRRGELLREYAQATYSIEHMCEETRGVYERLLD